MANWNISIKRVNRGGFTIGWSWEVTSEKGDYLCYDPWNGGEFLSGDAALSDAMRNIALYEVKKSKVVDIKTGDKSYELETAWNASK
jgi:hypothetical protein